MDKNLELIKKRKFNRDISWEEIKQAIKNFEDKVSKYYGILLYMLVVFIILFTLASIIKNKTNFYSEDLTFRWKNVLSYDDMLYSRDIYTVNQNYEEKVMHMCIHPFFDFMAQGVATIENMIFTNNNPTDHYYHIVLFQKLINLIGVFYLYKILREELGLKKIWCFLTITIYEIATVTLLGTFIIESFLISGTLLILSYYYLSKQKLIISTILGILVAGMCITNSIAFAIMAIFLLKDKKNILKVGVSCVVVFLLVMLILPYREYIFESFFNSIKTQKDTYTLDYGLVEFIKMAFYYIGASPIFFLNSIHIVTPAKGLDYFIFDLSSSKLVMIATIMFFIFILYNVIRNIKDRNMLAAFGVFVYNMFIHVILRFGLYEGTIYGLHYLFAEILMFAFGFKIKNKIIRRVFICFSILLLLVQIRYNMNGMLNLLLLFKDWK